MGYTALEKMRVLNNERYDIDGSIIPEIAEKMSGNVEEQALKFIRTACENLNFKKFPKNEAYPEYLEDLDAPEGYSVKSKIIPYNMEKDVDRLCLENAIHRFMKSGVAVDAFDVYFCYLEMFVGNYKNSKKMIEMLAEFEQNASSLLMKHRDHYSHSVYVFLLGLAIYQNNSIFKDEYKKFYGLEDDKEAAHHYLRYWGMASLFHDIGYPFELPFEEVKSYFGKTEKNVPFVAYKGVDEYVKTGDKEKLRKLLGDEEISDDKLTINYMLAKNIADKLAGDYSDFKLYKKYEKENEGASYLDYLLNAVFGRKASDPDNFGGFMDHAYFSAVVLTHKLLEVMDENQLNPTYADTITAIAMHNSMYKYSVTNVGRDDDGNLKDEFNAAHHFKLESHPLAYMLMLCDELQCWDRTSYGQNSRSEYHPMWCDLKFDGNSIKATYVYDKDFEDRVKTGTYKKMTRNGDEKSKFLKDIEDIISINENGIELSIESEIAENTRETNLYLSDSNFLHLYNFAVSLNAMYDARDYKTHKWVDMSDEAMEASFENLSLEYKLSNIAQAKGFAKYLDAIGCFYTDRPVAYELKKDFTVEELRKIGLMEHDRWDDEKYAMGWKYGTKFVEAAKSLGIDKKIIREQTRTHNDLGVKFNQLSKTEQNKDTDPMNDMMKLIEKYDGLRVYKIPGRTTV